MLNLDPTYSLRQISLAVGLCKSRISLGSTNIIPRMHSVINRFLLLTKKVGVHSVMKCKSVLNNDRRFLSAICVTDECTLTLNKSSTLFRFISN
jgi:hypothetical protein